MFNTAAHINVLPNGDRVLVTGSGRAAVIPHYPLARRPPVLQRRRLARGKGSTPWLKVTASDALGGSIAQTTANAYTIGSI